MLKWGNTEVTAVKWGSTNCTEVYWGSTKVFPDEVILYNGGDASSNFIGQNWIWDYYTSDSYDDYWWGAFPAEGMMNYNIYWSATNPRKGSGTTYSEFSLTNGLWYYSRHAWVNLSEENQVLSGYTKFIYNTNKLDFSNKTTIKITINNTYAKVPIYVGGVSSTGTGSSVKFTWCVRSDTIAIGTSTLSFTIPSANRNADCYFAFAGTLASELGRNNEFSHTITKISYY